MRAMSCIMRELVRTCVVVGSLQCGPSFVIWNMVTLLMTFQILLPMLAALAAQWALGQVFIGGTFVPMLHGWITSTVLKLGWLEVSIEYVIAIWQSFHIVFSLGWHISCVYYVLGN